MKNNRFIGKNILIALIPLLHCVSCAAQNELVIKKACGTNGGSKLYLHIRTNDTILSSKGLYELAGFTGLDDSLKLAIVEQLLVFEKDTSKCCLPVSGYLYNNVEGCGGSPQSTFYPIQIDALFMINRICFSNLTDWYACHPVLYDTLGKKEINDRPELIALVFENYKKWFKECKANKKIPGYFPFNKGRYVWYGGRRQKF